jgi:hypothetical protein
MQPIALELKGSEGARTLSLAARRLRSLGRFSSYRKPCVLRKTLSSYVPASDSNLGSRDCDPPVPPGEIRR